MDMKTLQKMGFALALFCLAANSFVSTASASEIGVNGDIYLSVNSMYLWRGFDLSPDSDFVVNPGVDVSVGKVTFGYWSNYDEDISEVNETDIFIDYSFDINDMFSVSLGNTYYSLDTLPDTNEAYFSITLNSVLSPTLQTYWDWDEASEDGLFFSASIGHDFELNKSISLHFGGEVSYNQKSDFLVGNYTDWHHAEANLSLTYSLADQIILNPIFRASTPLSDDAEDIAGLDDEVMGGLTILLTF
jgi:uncharacterized protein (TIGR02001 family)